MWICAMNICGSATDWSPFINCTDTQGLTKILFSVFIQKEFQSKNNICKIICHVSISGLKIQCAVLALVRNEETPRRNWTKDLRSFFFFFCIQEALIISFHQTRCYISVSASNGNLKMQFSLFSLNLYCLT